MRLWHYELIQYLPDKMLLSQWRELNSIFEHHKKHILINYVYEYPKLNLWYYTKLVSDEMIRRHFKISVKAAKQADNYFGDITATLEEAKAMNGTNPFPNHHTDGYLIQCYFNLHEKYNRKSEAISDADMEAITMFILSKFGSNSLYDIVMFFK